jgi:hypothetical protein
MSETLKEKREARLDICKACPELSRLLGGTCKKCGCNMLAKTWIPISTCPIGKW